MPRPIPLLLLMAIASVASQPHRPALPEQTVWQRSLFERVSVYAAQQSQEAEKPLLDYLDSRRFRRGLARCCPSMKAFSAKVLLERLQAEIKVSELVSGFPASSPTGDEVSDSWWNPSIEEGFRSSYFESQWQVRILHNGSFAVGKDFGGWFGVQDDVEVQVYGLRPFSHRGVPANISEASERGPYCALNTIRADAGSPLYGDVSAVFSPTRAKATALLSAVDTGSFEGMCNSSVGNRISPGLGRLPGATSNPLEHNCSAFPWGPKHLGTMEHFNHLLMINEQYWNGSDASTLLRTFARFFSGSEPEFSGWGKSHPLQGPDFIHYFESIPAANFHFPRDVKFLIGKFPSLFGTLQGAQLQQWCLQEGWLLVWALGLNVDDRVGDEGLNFFSAPFLKGSFPSNRRLLDPTVLRETKAIKNLTSDLRSVEAFDTVWIETQRARARAALMNTTVSQSEWAKLFDQLSGELLQTMQLEPLRANSCSDIDRCIGTDMRGTCVCYDSTWGAQAAQDNFLLI